MDAFWKSSLFFQSEKESRMSIWLNNLIELRGDLIGFIFIWFLAASL